MDHRKGVLATSMHSIEYISIMSVNGAFYKCLTMYYGEEYTAGGKSTVWRQGRLGEATCVSFHVQSAMRWFYVLGIYFAGNGRH